MLKPIRLYPSSSKLEIGNWKAEIGYYFGIKVKPDADASRIPAERRRRKRLKVWQNLGNRRTDEPQNRKPNKG